jgi:hypothetical protein
VGRGPVDSERERGVTLASHLCPRLPYRCNVPRETALPGTTGLDSQDLSRTVGQGAGGGAMEGRLLEDDGNNEASGEDLSASPFCSDR